MSIDLISGSQLKILLKRRGIKINDLVEVFDFNRITISRYFNDRNPIPADFIVKVAAYANLSLNDLIEGGFPEAQVIDITPPPPAITAAAEPAPVYESKKAPDPVPAAPSPLVSIDVSALDIIIHELRTKLTVMELELSRIKQEMELVHH